MSSQKHVAVLTFPFSSHPRTLITLLLKMATSAPTIAFSFFNTRSANHSLLSSSDLDLPSNVKIYNVEDGVPLGHKFSGGHHERMDLFLKSARENIERKIQTVAVETGINLTFIVSDCFLSPFACEIAEQMNIPWIPFSTSLPSRHVFYKEIQIIHQRIRNGNADRDQNLDFIPALSLMRMKDLPGDMLSFSHGSGKSVFLKTLSAIGDAVSKATVLAVSSFEELNPEALNKYFNSKFEDFLNLGIIAESLTSSDSDLDPEGCLSWLDKQHFRSVAYICFGTVAGLPDKELQELAGALEFSRVQFLWSLNENLKAKLPNGFLERTRKQGKIVSWTPQRLVLDHDSVAVFISHSGYTGVQESIFHGVPIICRPVFGDQAMGARLVEDGWGIGVKVEDGGITKDGILKSLEAFLPADNERGKKIRENVHELKKVVRMASQPGGSAARDFNKLIQIISSF
ncbi:Anthocyanidin 3-O-glucosyltransferase [Euphorbia peplus]|nr:Anthocyanidin 3-O-glucosyltransferase [Euphorbia peplus]